MQADPWCARPSRAGTAAVTQPDHGAVSARRKAGSEKRPAGSLAVQRSCSRGTVAGLGGVPEVPGADTSSRLRCLKPGRVASIRPQVRHDSRPSGCGCPITITRFIETLPRRRVRPRLRSHGGKVHTPGGGHLQVGVALTRAGTAYAARGRGAGVKRAPTGGRDQKCAAEPASTWGGQAQAACWLDATLPSPETPRSAQIFRCDDLLRYPVRCAANKRVPHGIPGRCVQGQSRRTPCFNVRESASPLVLPLAPA